MDEYILIKIRGENTEDATCLLDNALLSLNEATKLRNSAAFVNDKIWVLQKLGKAVDAEVVCKSFNKKMTNLSETYVIGFRLGYGKLLVSKYCGTVYESNELRKGYEYIQQAIGMAFGIPAIYSAMEEHMQYAENLDEGLLKNLHEACLLYEESNLHRETHELSRTNSLYNLGWLKLTFRNIRVAFKDKRSETDCFTHAYRFCETDNHQEPDTASAQDILSKLIESYVCSGACFESIWDFIAVEICVDKLKELGVTRWDSTDLLTAEKEEPLLSAQEHGHTESTLYQLDVDNLEFHEQIGEGGFGTVKRVTFKNQCKGYNEAAAKVILRKESSITDEEAEIMSQLKHANIVLMLGFCQTETVNIIVLEYARKGSLHDFLADNSNSLPQHLQNKWMRESGLALQYLHTRDFLHRDIKANNCLLFENCVLKLCDFGLARQLESSSAVSSQKGTVMYMAPELHTANNVVYSKFTDIWSYGMLVLEIQGREPPFSGMDHMHIIYMVGSGKLLPTIPPGCTESIKSLMRQCWVIDPKERPSMDTIIKDLLPLAEV